MTPEQAKDLWSKIKPIQVAMLVTEDHGDMRARPMHHVQDEFSGKLYFYTSARSGKISEIKKDAAVCLVYEDHRSETYVSITGTANIRKDQALIDAYWNKAIEAYFPEGKTDPDLAMLEVHVDQAEYWDSTSNRMVQMFEFVKANLTGKRPDLGEHRVIN